MKEDEATTFVRGQETPDMRVRLSLLTRSAGGRTKPVVRRYSPHFLIRHGYLTSGRLVDVQPDPLLAGETGTADVRLLSPEVYPGTLWVGRVLSVQEAVRPVGTATVLAIYNPLLVAERLPSEWASEPTVFTTMESARRALVADAPAVRIAAIRYLATAGEDWVLNEYRDDPDSDVRAAVLSLSR